MQTRGVAPELAAPFSTPPTVPQSVVLEETLAILQQQNTELQRENTRLKLANAELRQRLEPA